MVAAEERKAGSTFPFNVKVDLPSNPLQLSQALKAADVACSVGEKFNEAVPRLSSLMDNEQWGPAIEISEGSIRPFRPLSADTTNRHLCHLLGTYAWCVLNTHRVAEARTAAADGPRLLSTLLDNEYYKNFREEVAGDK